MVLEVIHEKVEIACVKKKRWAEKEERGGLDKYIEFLNPHRWPGTYFLREKKKHEVFWLQGKFLKRNERGKQSDSLC